MYSACSMMALIGAKPVPLATEEDGFVAVFAQEESAQRAFEAQDVALLHHFEDVLGEFAGDDVTDMQLQKFVIVQRVRQRKAARLIVLDEDVDILAGEELQRSLAGSFSATPSHRVVMDCTRHGMVFAGISFTAFTSRRPDSIGCRLAQQNASSSGASASVRVLS